MFRSMFSSRTSITSGARTRPIRTWRWLWNQGSLACPATRLCRHPLFRKSLLDDYTEVFSHELVESVSDPFLDGVRLPPQVQAARSIADDSNELGGFAQSFAEIAVSVAETKFAEFDSNAADRIE